MSRARQEFLSEHPAEIWKRHHEVGFILVFDGSEDRLLRFRDGKWAQFDLTDLSSQSITLLWRNDYLFLNNTKKKEKEKKENPPEWQFSIQILTKNKNDQNPY